MQIFHRVQRHAAVVLIGLCALALAGTASAAAPHTLQDLSYQVLPGGKVELSLHFDAVPAAPRAFTTNTPPRIALDFADTNNAVTARHVDIGAGATSGVSVVAANGRTRVVIDLFRSAPYRVHETGDTMVITIGNGQDTSSTAGAYASTDPTKAAPAAGPSVSNVDFRRGDHGGGRVIVEFSGAGAHADMHREDNRIVVTLSNVQLPAKLAQHLDVNDFATPVKFIDTRATRTGATLNIAAGGDFEASAYQTATEYVIEIAPKAEPKVKAPELGTDGLPKPVYTGQRVDFNFQNIPVRQVLHLIASESNLNLVVADSVEGNVTLRLKNVPWDQALDIVLRAKGLDQRKSGNVLWVAPQEEIAKREEALAKARQAQEVNAPLISAYIPISYGKASDIAALLTTDTKQSSGGGGGGATTSTSRGFLSARGSVSFDERTNTLLVNDTAEQVTKIRNLVAKLDKPVQQVLIESRIVIATDTFARELGIKFGVSGGYEDRNGNVLTTSGNLATAAGMEQQAVQNRLGHRGAFPITPNQFGFPQLPDRLNVNLPATTINAGSFGLAILGADYLLDLELSAGQTEGKSEIISSPKVITANQQPATIAQGQQIGYQTTTTTSGGGSQPTVAFKDATLSLGVTPTITNDNRVFLALDVKKDSLAGYYQSATGQLPLIDHREIKTSVLVDDGATVVLGGISEQNKTDSITKVPLLGDIPVLGALFRTKSKTNSRAELLIFVTPRILSDKLK